METDNISLRLKMFLEDQGLISSQFADACGIPRPSFSQLLSGRNKKVSDVIISQIHHAYPNLSILWLLFGEGNMYVDGKGDNHTHNGESDGLNMQENSTNKNLGENLGPLNSDLFSDTSEFMTDDKVPLNNRILNTAKPNQKQSQNNITPTFSTQQRRVNNSLQINKKTENPRKVVQIMVYYDDSTFETFYPSSQK